MIRWAPREWVNAAFPVALARHRLLVSAALALSLIFSSSGDAQEPPARTAVLLEVDGAIGPATTEYLRSGFETAADRGASLIVLSLDTPGGLASSTRDIVRDILASPVPIITFVAPAGARAASAGTYILYASHLAAMAPGTNLGAATPIPIGRGAQPLREDPSESDGDGRGGEDHAAAAFDDASSAKAVNDAVASIRSLADLHGRNADWAEDAVREAASLPARAAIEQDVVEIVATDLPDLLAQADGRTVQLDGAPVTLQTVGLEVLRLEPDWRAQALSAITNPNIAYILLLVGIYGIILELISPGTVFPGVIGAIALVVALYALNLLPISFAGAGLMLLGVGLLVAEAFVASFGILGLGGVVAFGVGSLFLFEEVPGFRLSPAVVLIATAASATLLAVMLAAVVRAHRRAAVSGDAAMIGAVGKVLSWSGQAGEIQIHGERWQARSLHPAVPGEFVRVIRREKLVLIIEPEKPSKS